jgi:hypothetical protein
MHPRPHGADRCVHLFRDIIDTEVQDVTEDERSPVFGWQAGNEAGDVEMLGDDRVVGRTDVPGSGALEALKAPLTDDKVVEDDAGPRVSIRMSGNDVPALPGAREHLLRRSSASSRSATYRKAIPVRALRDERYHSSNRAWAGSSSCIAPPRQIQRTDYAKRCKSSTHPRCRRASMSLGSSSQADHTAPKLAADISAN